MCCLPFVCFSAQSYSGRRRTLTICSTRASLWPQVVEQLLFSLNASLRPGSARPAISWGSTCCTSCDCLHLCTHTHTHTHTHSHSLTPTDRHQQHSLFHSLTSGTSRTQLTFRAISCYSKQGFLSRRRDNCSDEEFLRCGYDVMFFCAKATYPCAC